MQTQRAPSESSCAEERRPIAEAKLNTKSELLRRRRSKLLLAMKATSGGIGARQSLNDPQGWQARPLLRSASYRDRQTPFRPKFCGPAASTSSWEDDHRDLQYRIRVAGDCQKNFP